MNKNRGMELARITNAPGLEVGSEAPEFSLSSAQGGSLRLGMRTVRGPVVVAFFRGVWSEEDVEFFKALAAKEDEINAALGSVVGVGACEPEAARAFQRAVGLKSYVLYDYTLSVVSGWGLLGSDPEHGSYALPATFLVEKENRISAAWTDSRPTPEELLEAISVITGLPKEPEEGDEEEEKPARPSRSRRKAEPESQGDDEAAKPGNSEAGNPEAENSQVSEKGQGSDMESGNTGKEEKDEKDEKGRTARRKREAAGDGEERSGE